MNEAETRAELIDPALRDESWGIVESIRIRRKIHCCPVIQNIMSVVETLARDLQAEFPGHNGFSAQNLLLMRQFYCE